VRPLLIVAVALAAPIVPFVLLGDRLDAWLAPLESEASKQEFALLAGAILASDVVLPVPSSAVIALAGARLGATTGTLACWIGMNVGAIAAFALVRRWGRPLALRLASAEQLERLEHITSRYGAAVVVLTRALPVLAEAAVVLVAIHRLRWSRFLPALLLSNFGVALAYAAFGDYAADKEWLPIALAISLGAPVALAIAVYRSMRPATKNNETQGAR
jgi:uncharacterized membrane protein YdjX (TVP38/TMEM64 family)